MTASSSPSSVSGLNARAADQPGEDIVGNLRQVWSAAPGGSQESEELTVVRLPVELAPDERAAYERLSRGFASLRRQFFRRRPAARYDAMIRALAGTTDGAAALRAYGEAVHIAAFPRAKRVLISALLQRHRVDRTIVFTGRVEDAYELGERELVPVITSEVTADERARILAKLRDGRLRAVVSVRVSRASREAHDLPEARVAIVASCTLGEREHVERIGRVLRPAPGKRALVYELVTLATVDERVGRTRWPLSLDDLSTEKGTT